MKYDANTSPRGDDVQLAEVLQLLLGRGPARRLSRTAIPVPWRSRGLM